MAHANGIDGINLNKTHLSVVIVRCQPERNRFSGRANHRLTDTCSLTVRNGFHLARFIDRIEPHESVLTTDLIAGVGAPTRQIACTLPPHPLRTPVDEQLRRVSARIDEYRHSPFPIPRSPFPVPPIPMGEDVDGFIFRVPVGTIEPVAILRNARQVDDTEIR